MQNLENISSQIEGIHTYFSDYASKQVNYAYTLRNWLIGMCLFEFEQKGQERAEYGDKLYRNIALRLKEKNVKGMSFIMLHYFRKFFLTYPSIVQIVSEQLQLNNNQDIIIVQSLIEQFKINENGIVHSVIGQSDVNKENVKSIAIVDSKLFLSKVY
jgi:DUF1016 N-terminal domain